MKHRMLALPAAAAALLLLAGCGTTEAPRAEADPSATLTVTDFRGEEVSLDGPAERVVGTEWNVVENLVSLGVQPVGVADVAGYTDWVSAEPLEEGVTDIGTRGEPSIDAVAALAPDLVIATTDLPEAAIAQLEEFVPVIVVRSADASRQIEQALDNLRLIAEATGTESRADEVVASLEQHLADGAAAIEAAGLAGRRFAFADGWVSGGQVSIRPFVQGSLLGDISEELGLVNAWELEGDADYGLASTDVEGLTALGDVEFAYITNAVAEQDPFAGALAGNAVWQSLPFVHRGAVHRLADGIWLFGGPSSMEQYIDALVDALTA